MRPPLDHPLQTDAAIALVGKVYRKKAVEYTPDHGESDEQCSKCEYFEKPSACKIVMGHIEAKGWCRKFERK